VVGDVQLDEVVFRFCAKKIALCPHEGDRKAPGKNIRSNVAVNFLNMGCSLAKVCVAVGAVKDEGKDVDRIRRRCEGKSG
jgi:hypothetical protein